MTWAYGNSGGASLEESEIRKDIEVTTAKHKIRFQTSIWKPNAFHEFYAAVFDSSGVFVPMDGAGAPNGKYVYTETGLSDFTLVKTDGIDFTVGEVLQIRFRSLPWDPGFPLYFYTITLSLVD